VNQDSLLLKKVVELYECGFKNLIIQENKWDSSTCYILACLNNMGLLFQRLNRVAVESKKKCFQLLLSVLMVDILASLSFKSPMLDRS
jgi:hypothetical protein